MPAGRPTKKRTAKSYARDVESLSRLRMAILLNEGERGQKAVEGIDTLVKALIVLMPLESARSLE